MFRKLGLTFAAALTLAAITNAAQAEEYITQQVSITYPASQLDTADGAAALLGRIDTAAVEACGGKPFMQRMYSLAPGAVKQEYNKCHAKAVGDAVVSVGSPMLTGVYAQKNGAMQQVAGW